MRTGSVPIASLLLLGILSPTVLAQDKPKTDDKTKVEVQKMSNKTRLP
jgi:hypothetical protein